MRHNNNTLRSVGTIVLICVLLALAGQATATTFEVGVYTGDGRDLTCLSAFAGTTIEPALWAWVPNNLGLAYVTVRFEFPANIELLGRPILNDLIADVIYTDFPDGTAEWNMIFNDCPSGWVKVLTLSCRVVNESPSLIGILGSRSMIRDCTFVLNGVTVANELAVNDHPGCDLVGAEAMSWSGLKKKYR